MACRARKLSPTILRWWVLFSSIYFVGVCVVVWQSCRSFPALPGLLGTRLYPLTLIKSQTDCFVCGQRASLPLSLLPRFISHQTAGPGGGWRRRRNFLMVSMKNPFSPACCWCCGCGGSSSVSDSGGGRLGADILPPHPDNTQQDNGSAISAAAETMTVVIWLLEAAV